MIEYFDNGCASTQHKKNQAASALQNTQQDMQVRSHDVQTSTLSFHVWIFALIGHACMDS